MNDTLFGIIHTDSRMRYNKELINLEIDNKVFYTGNWYKQYQQLLEVLPIRLHNISYIEIAYDSFNKFERFKELYYASNLCNNNTYLSLARMDLHSLNGNSEFIFGGNKTGKRVGLYNKSLCNDDTGNIYIPAFHYNNGLIPVNGQSIDRIELRLDNNFLGKFTIPFKNITTDDGLLSIFAKFTKDVLSFHVTATARYDHNRNKKYDKIQVLNLDNLPKTNIQRKKVIGGSSAVSLRSIKIAFKTLLHLYLENGTVERLNQLKSFIASNTVAEGHAVAATANLEMFKELTAKYVDAYQGIPNLQVRERIQSITYDLFAEPDLQSSTTGPSVNWVVTNNAKNADGLTNMQKVVPVYLYKNVPALKKEKKPLIKNKLVRLRLPDELLAKVNLYAKNNNTDKSMIIRSLLETITHDLRQVA